jgi:hypothetical protein
MKLNKKEITKLLFEDEGYMSFQTELHYILESSGIDYSEKTEMNED